MSLCLAGVGFSPQLFLFFAPQLIDHDRCFPQQKFCCCCGRQRSGRLKRESFFPSVKKPRHPSNTMVSFNPCLTPARVSSHFPLFRTACAAALAVSTCLLPFLASPADAARRAGEEEKRPACCTPNIRKLETKTRVLRMVVGSVDRGLGRVPLGMYAAGSVEVWFASVASPRLGVPH